MAALTTSKSNHKQHDFHWNATNPTNHEEANNQRKTLGNSIVKSMTLSRNKPLKNKWKQLQDQQQPPRQVTKSAKQKRRNLEAQQRENQEGSWTFIERSDLRSWNINITNQTLCMPFWLEAMTRNALACLKESFPPPRPWKGNDLHCELPLLSKSVVSSLSLYFRISFFSSPFWDRMVNLCSFTCCFEWSGLRPPPSPSLGMFSFTSGIHEHMFTYCSLSLFVKAKQQRRHILVVLLNKYKNYNTNNNKKKSVMSWSCNKMDVCLWRQYNFFWNTRYGFQRSTTKQQDAQLQRQQQKEGEMRTRPNSKRKQELNQNL